MQRPKPHVLLPAILAGAWALGATPARAATQPDFYHLQSVMKLHSSNTSWDHIDFDPATKYVYMSRRADGLTVVDSRTGKIVAQVANARGAGSVALVPELDRGFTANTDGSTSVFKLSDFSPVDRVTTLGDNFDGVTYDPASKRLAFTKADNSILLIVDPATVKAVASVTVDGTQLERPIPDGKGDIFMPIRDRALVYKIDMSAGKIVGRYDIAPGCTEPSGGAFDAAGNRLLLGCRGKQVKPVLAVMNPDSGAITQALPIGRGVDDVVFDPASGQAFTANGVDGNLVIFHRQDADHYVMTQAVSTRPGARVVRYDADSRRLFTMTADGAVDPAKKNLAFISPFYANYVFPDSFVLLTYAPQ